MTSSGKINSSDCFDKIEYIDELILKLQILYSKNIIDSDFFDKAVELLDQEKLDVSYTNKKVENNIYKAEEYLNFNDMSPEQKQKYIEIQKQRIKMTLIEAKNFSELNIIYDRIHEKIYNTDEKLEEFLKLECTKRFEILLESSCIYCLIKDYNKNYGTLNIEDLMIDDYGLKLKNSEYKYEINKEILKKQKIRNTDENELESLKTIVNDIYSRFKDDFIEEKLKYIIKIPQKQIDIKERIKKIKATIQKILNRDENRFFRSTLSIDYDFKFDDKLNKCKNTYKTEFKAEIPFIIFDNTIFKTCEKGFVITDKNFYFKNQDEDAYKIDIDDIDDIELREDSLYINENTIYCDIVTNNYREHFKDIITIITYLIQNGKESSSDIDLIIEQVISI